MERAAATRAGGSVRCFAVMAIALLAHPAASARAMAPAAPAPGVIASLPRLFTRVSTDIAAILIGSPRNSLRVQQEISPIESAALSEQSVDDPLCLAEIAGAEQV